MRVDGKGWEEKGGERGNGKTRSVRKVSKGRKVGRERGRMWERQL